MIIVADIALWLAMGANLTLAIMNARLNRQLRQKIAEIRQHGLSTDNIAEIQRRITMQIGLDQDLVERIITDLAFMHGQLYESTGHDCPVCKSTAPELEQLLAKIRTLQVHIEQK